MSNSEDSKQSETADGEEPKQVDRDQWGHKAEFLLSCIGFSVGIGNVWRFPYLAYQNGGGTFLFAYVIMLLIAGKPLYFAELSLGQFSGRGSVQVWRCFPVAKGIGVAMAVLSINVAIYYNVIMGYTLYYIAQSFRAEVPWAACNSWWGADKNCYVREGDMNPCRDVNKTLVHKYSAVKNNTDWESTAGINITYNDKTLTVPLEEYEKAAKSCINETQTASEQFWEKYVLELTSGIDDLGTLKWDLVLFLLVCWFIVFLGLSKGIKSTGKIVYFTATFPYVILITLVIYGCTLSGAIHGIKYFFVPEWSKVLDIKVWKYAAEQLLFSLGIGFGCLIMYASYNKFDGRLYRDAMFVSILDFLTSLLSGMVIFTVLGHLSTEMGIEISKVAKQGPGLTFVTYPEALARLPVPQLWTVLFFFMLFLLAIDSEFSYMENIFTICCDEFPYLKKKKPYLAGSLCLTFFILGLPCVLQGGQYIWNLMDIYGAGDAGIIVTTFEIMAIGWGYGAKRFSYDIKFMLGFRPSLYWRICWQYCAPLVLLFVLIYSIVTHKIASYAGVEYPYWGEVLGFCLMLVSVLQIPIWAVVELYKNRKNIKAAFHPHPDWGPLDPETRRQYEVFRQSPEIHGCLSAVPNPEETGTSPEDA